MIFFLQWTDFVEALGNTQWFLAIKTIKKNYHYNGEKELAVLVQTPSTPSSYMPPPQPFLRAHLYSAMRKPTHKTHLYQATKEPTVDWDSGTSEPPHLLGFMDPHSCHIGQDPE